MPLAARRAGKGRRATRGAKSSHVPSGLSLRGRTYPTAPLALLYPHAGGPLLGQGRSPSLWVLGTPRMLVN